MNDRPMDTSLGFPLTAGLRAAPDFVALPETGLESPLSQTQSSVLSVVRRFAREVMRPQGAALDRMTAEEVIAKGSPYWRVMKQFAELGIGASTLSQIDEAERADLYSLVFEELGAGDSGLAVSMGAGLIGHLMARKWGRTDLLEAFPETQLGCWGITEPDHGSDTLDWTRATAHPGSAYGRPNLVARPYDGGVILSGQKSAWVSNGPVAQFCTLYAAFDRGAGREGINVFTPLDLPGVSRGAPLDKMGQRALPQGEIFFDQVKVPGRFIAAGPEQYAHAVHSILTEANACMGAIFTGVARAGYEHALAYAMQRRQGGVPIVRHQSVRARLFRMFMKVEQARALNRRVLNFNQKSVHEALQGSIASKITSTQAAFEVASDAIQMLGGNGLTRAYPVEKLLRDARASMIEDGCNEMLAIKGGGLLVDPDALAP